MGKHRIKYFFFIVAVLSCSDEKDNRDYRQAMRELIEHIAVYARSINSNFLIVPQNGIELISTDKNVDGPLDEYYFNTVTAFAQEDLFFGYSSDNELTPLPYRNYLLRYLDRIRSLNKPVLVIDYCSTPEKMDSSYLWNEHRGFISFAAPSRELDRIPSYPLNPYNNHPNSVKYISSAKNFLYLINPRLFSSKKAYLDAIAETNYDVLILDLFFKDTALTMEDMERIKNKRSGVPRRLLCYMSIGEAEDYRYYWKADWHHHPPSWLVAPNPDWPGNYKVRYWNPEWQAILYGNDQSYTKKIIDAGFYGAYLDIVDAFEWFEK